MLVLSRRLNEKIVFPSLDAVVQVVEITPHHVRLGIDAPKHVKVFRQELLDDAATLQFKLDGYATTLTSMSAAADLTHSQRNILNKVAVGIALARRQLKSGMLREAATTLSGLDAGFETVVSTPAQATATSRPRSALLVEDDRNESALLAGLLRLSGFDVATATDGEAALNRLQAVGVPDVMLLDMVLPKCDGPTTVRAVRQDPSLQKLRIIAVSGYSPQQLNLDLGSSGIDAWFQKPIEPEALLRELEASLPPHTAA